MNTDNFQEFETNIFPFLSKNKSFIYEKWCFFLHAKSSFRHIKRENLRMKV